MNFFRALFLYDYISDYIQIEDSSFSSVHYLSLGNGVVSDCCIKWMMVLGDEGKAWVFWIQKEKKNWKWAERQCTMLKRELRIPEGCIKLNLKTEIL